MERTVEAVEKQIAAMGCEVFEVGLLKPDASPAEPTMVPRIWDRESLSRSIPWMRHQNLHGRNIYVRPKGEHQLSLVDDLDLAAVTRMKQTGFGPAVVVETSPGNYQAWLKHPEQLHKELGTAIARALAKTFGGDLGAADWRHFGRLAGFTNRKAKYRNEETRLYPFVRVVEAAGSVYPAAKEFLETIRRELEEQRQQRDRRIETAARSYKPRGPLRSIATFRSDQKYGGDGTRIDLAYSIYALSHDVGRADVAAAIRSRDLSHKGSERRQSDYVARTINKALANLERSASGRSR
jgi:hypothetical protein